MATDHFEDPSLTGLRIADLFDLVAVSGIHYDQARERGVVFHMMSAHHRARPGRDDGGRGHRRRGRPERYADAETRLRDEARVASEPHTIW